MVSGIAAVRSCTGTCERAGKSARDMLVSIQQPTVVPRAYRLAGWACSSCLAAGHWKLPTLMGAQCPPRRFAFLLPLSAGRDPLWLIFSSCCTGRKCWRSCTAACFKADADVAGQPDICLTRAPGCPAVRCFPSSQLLTAWQQQGLLHPLTLPDVRAVACLLPLPGCADCTLLLVAPEACKGALGVAAACSCCFSASTSCNE